MISTRHFRVVALVALALGFTSTAFAADAGAPKKSSTTDVGGRSRRLDGGAGVASPIENGEAVPDEGQMPSGHPQVADDEDDDAPPQQQQATANPHGTKPQAVPGVFQPPADQADEDPKLPKGTIALEIRDAEDHPVPHASVTMGIVHNSVAKGEKHDHLVKDTDDHGDLEFSDLENTSSVAYRLSVNRGAGVFSATPFRLPEDHGMRVVLHVYDVTSDIGQALIVSQVVMYIELKDDRVQMEEAVTIFNFGKIAWVPEDVIFKLPENFTALNGQQSMSAQGVDSIEKQGAKLHGTFPPGRAQIEFRWQLPYAGSSEVAFDAGMPPHLAAVRVMAVAADPMRLSIAGFDDPHPDLDGEGNHVLVTDKQMRANDAPIHDLQISLRDIPTPGPARVVATSIAAVGVLFGLVVTTRRRAVVRDRGASKRERQRLLEELEDLERAHLANEVGPKTYERARRELVDAIARTLDTRDV
ncbi:MAG: hypothetical protein ABI183_08910 [Polyangiaceae bacterium]